MFWETILISITCPRGSHLQGNTLNNLWTVGICLALFLYRLLSCMFAHVYLGWWPLFPSCRSWGELPWSSQDYLPFRYFIPENHHAEVPLSLTFKKDIIQHVIFFSSCHSWFPDLFDSIWFYLLILLSLWGEIYKKGISLGRHRRAPWWSPSPALGGLRLRWPRCLRWPRAPLARCICRRADARPAQIPSGDGAVKLLFIIKGFWITATLAILFQGGGYVPK